MTRYEELSNKLIGLSLVLDDIEDEVLSAIERAKALELGSKIEQIILQEIDLKKEQFDIILDAMIDTEEALLDLLEDKEQAKEALLDLLNSWEVIIFSGEYEDFNKRVDWCAKQIYECDNETQDDPTHSEAPRIYSALREDLLRVYIAAGGWWRMKDGEYVFVERHSEK